MLKRASMLILFIIIALIANAFLNPIPQSKIPEGFKPIYGFSFSFEQSAWYGLNPRGSYISLLDEIKPDWVRLPFFWDQMIDSDGNFNENFEDLKFAIEEAQMRNIKVIIALGAKAPYYPEYHIPKSFQAQLKPGQEITLKDPIASQILAIDRKVVEKLMHFDNISHWQIENEPFLPNVNGWRIGEKLLEAEVDLVRAQDSKKRPIILNHPGPALYDTKYKKLFNILKPGDVLGVNAYFKTQGVNLISLNFSNTSFNIKWPKWLVLPVQSWPFFSVNFEKLQKEAQSKNLDFWVLEMQTEPYIRELNQANNPYFTFTTRDIKLADSYLRSKKIKSIGLWGAHFWQYRQKIGDSSWIEAVGQIVN